MKKTGYVSKKEYQMMKNDIDAGFDDDLPNVGVFINGVSLYQTRGEKEDWAEDDWPPVKIEFELKELPE